MPRGTPSHTITQTMLAKHQYRFFCRSLFISRSNTLHAMIPIEGNSISIHHISQISQESGTLLHN